VTAVSGRPKPEIRHCRGD